MERIKKKFPIKEVVNTYVALMTIVSINSISYELRWDIDDILLDIKKYSERLNKEKQVLLKKYGESKGYDNRGEEIFNIEDKDKIEKYRSELKKLEDTKIEITFLPLDFKRFKEEKVKVVGEEITSLRENGFVIRDKKEEKEKKEEEK